MPLNESGFQWIIVQELLVVAYAEQGHTHRISPTTGFKQRYSEVFGMQLWNISGVYRARTLVVRVCDLTGLILFLSQVASPSSGPECLLPSKQEPNG